MFSKKNDYGHVDNDNGKSQGHSGFSFKDMMSKASEFFAFWYNLLLELPRS